MGDEDVTSTTKEPVRGDASRGSNEAVPALVIAHAPEPGRLGEVFLLEGGSHVIGRGGPRTDDPAPRLSPVRQRPGANTTCPPLESPFLSRVQLRLRRAGDAVDVENAGRGRLRDDRGREAGSVRISAGQSVSVGDELLLLCVARPRRLPAARNLGDQRAPDFGEPDETGFVGESASAWKLRDAIAFLAGRSAHVLLLGPSGAGKEIAAQTIHRLSDRGARRLVSRNAATIPDTLVEAELFGHAANYPNAGTPERAGLIGEADGSTLFLDEIGELKDDLQTKLLRLLDSGGDYQRLGDARRRTADVRFVAATNRSLDALREDLAARLKLRLTLPGLADRIEDVPLLARHLLRTIAKRDAAVGARFLAGCDGSNGEPRLTLALARALLLHEYKTHVRELEALLWASISTSAGDTLDVTPEVRASLRTSAEPIDFEAITADDVRAALARSGGVRDVAWRELGLANRHVLKRLMKKLGVAAEPQED